MERLLLGMFGMAAIGLATYAAAGQHWALRESRANLYRHPRSRWARFSHVLAILIYQVLVSIVMAAAGVALLLHAVGVIQMA